MPLEVAEAVLESTGAALLLLREDGVVARVNPAAVELLGVPAEQLLGREAADLLTRPRDAAELRSALRQVSHSGRSCVHETQLDEPAGSGRRSVAWAVSPVAGEAPLLALLGIDISATRSQLEELQNRALTDELTGLGNRAQLMLRLEELSGTGASLVFCDLNGFKAVNDTHGHAAGDQVLVEVARRFVRAVRGEDLVVRLGGDEFVIVAPASPTFDPAGLRRRVLGALRQPMLLSGGLVVLVGVAVGMACLEPGADPAEVLKQADADMYAGKPMRTSLAAVAS